MSKILVAPNGLLIRGTLEWLSGVGLIYKADLKNGRLEFEFYGETEILVRRDAHRREREGRDHVRRRSRATSGPRAS